MPLFEYTVLNQNGKRIKDTYTAQTASEVTFMLKEREYIILNVEEVKNKTSISLFTNLQRVTSKDLAVFCRQFQAMLNAGVPIINCLDIIKQQTDNKRLRNIINDLFENLQKGFTFSEALRKHDNVFPEILINMVEAGEVSGNLDVIMDRLAIHFEKEFKIENKIKGAMAYPIVLAIVATAVVIFLLTSVMPTFIGMFESSGVELPAPTIAMLNMSDFIQNRWYIIIIFITLIIVLVKTLSSNKSTKIGIDKLKLEIPILKNVNLKIATSRFTRTLSTLLGSGVPLINALEIVAKVTGNEYIGSVILKSKEDVRKGIGLSEPLKHSRVFPPMVTSMMKIGEDSGAIEEILAKTADFYDEEVDSAVQKLTTVLEPIMIVFMALIIGFIVIAMVMPMFDMVSTIQ